MIAAVVIVFAPTFLLYLFLSDKIIAGVTGGAIKGWPMNPILTFVRGNAAFIW